MCISMDVVKAHARLVFPEPMTFTGRHWHGHMTVHCLHRPMSSHKKQIARCGVILEMDRPKRFSEASRISEKFLAILNSVSCHGHFGVTVVVVIGPGAISIVWPIALLSN